MRVDHYLSNSPVSLYGIDGVEAVDVRLLDVGARWLGIREWISTDGTVTTTIDGTALDDLLVTDEAGPSSDAGPAHNDSTTQEASS